MMRRVLIVLVVAFAFNKLLKIMFDEDEPVAPAVTDQKESSPSVAKLILTAEQLQAKCNSKELYIAILGSVYDVSKGAKHYGKGGSYEFFVGRDASRAFVTGDFEKDLNDNLEGLSESQIADIINWKKFYDKSYTHIGYVVGRFYDANGEKTEYLVDAERALATQYEKDKENAKFQARFPPCNSEWTQEKGLHRVWCSTESGGVKRSWIGHPRLVYNPTTKSESCACVNKADLSHASVKSYPNCNPTATECNPSHA